MKRGIMRIMSENTNVFKNIFTKALFILGIIIIVIILAFAVIKIMPKVFSGFASVGKIFKSPFVDKTISISSANDDDLKSGETTVLAWEYEPTEEGSYILKYSCVSNVQLSMATTNGLQRLICNTPYTFGADIQAVEITPTLTKENIDVTIPFSIEFINNEDDSVADGDVKIGVTNKKVDPLASAGTIISTTPVITGAANNQPTTPPVVRPTTPTNTQPVYNYPRIADIALSNMVDTGNGLISFTVSNIGSAVTGNWVFNYTTPDGETTYSPTQVSLNPGDAIRYTLRFTDLTDGTMTIVADPQNFVYETNNSNNSISMRVSENGNGNGGGIDYDRNDDADLEIDSFEVGRMDGNRFREDDTIDEDDDAAVRFTVINRGGESTGSWRFEIENTPDDDDDYRSRVQSSMRPGESRTFTVEFENPDTGTFRMKLVLDSDDDVDEEDENNNDETEELEVEQD